MSEPNAALELPPIQDNETMAEYMKRTSDKLGLAVADDDKRTKPGPRKAEQPKEPDGTQTRETPEAKGTKDAQGKGDEHRDGADNELLSEDAAEKLSPEGTSFARLKRSNKAAIKALGESKSKLTALEKEIAELKAKPVTATNTAELEALKTERESIKKERDELATLLKSVGLERSPEFQAKYKGRTDAILNTAKRTLPADVYAQAESVLALPPSPAKLELLEKIAENVPHMTSNLLAQFASQMDQVAIEREAELAEGARGYDNLVQTEAQKRQSRQTQYQAVFDQALAKIMSKESGIDLFQKTGNPEQDAVVEEMASVAKRAWSGEMPAEQLATLQLWGSAYPHQLKANAELARQLEEAQKTIKELRGASPSIKAGEEGGGDDAALKPKDGETMGEYGRRIAPRFGIAR